MLIIAVAATAFALGTALAIIAARRTAGGAGRLARLLHPGQRAAVQPFSGGLSEPADVGLVEPRIEPETVEALLDNARALADGEQERGASLKQRAGWLLGFIGVTLSLVLAQTREFARSDLGGVGKPVAAALVLIALCFILDAARWALRTLSVVKLWHVDPEEAQRYPSWAYVGKRPEVARGEMLQGWVRQFADERPANDIKAEELQRAFRRLAVGIAVLAAVGVIVSARAFGV